MFIFEIHTLLLCLCLIEVQLLQVVLEEGLNISSLPETMKEDFEKLNRFEGQYRVTSFLMEEVDLEASIPRRGPLCAYCNVKNEAERQKTILEYYKSMTTFSKVILISIQEMKTRIYIAQGGGGVVDVQDGGQMDRVHGEREHYWPT